LRRVDSILQKASAERIFQSACLLVVDGGQPKLHQSFGKASLDSVFDLASLTKPLATGLALMQLCEQQKLALDQPLGELLPLATDHPLCGQPLWVLLAHCSGLAPWRPFYEHFVEQPAFKARKLVRQQILTQPLLYAPQSESRYSDLGFILLAWIVERVTRRRLDRLLRDTVYRPLGVGLHFVDSSKPKAPQRPYVATERCPRRGRLLGQVHDDNCYAMGGICGHAGLFGSAHDVHIVVRELVAAFLNSRSLLSREVVRRFWSAKPVEGSSWALGWDRPSGPRSSAGSLAPPDCIGHLGFTGTSIWIEPRRERWVVFLSNRVFYGREPNRLKALRPRLHDAIWRALG
jgi:CubicO group peptidase (beta-lactamase class C family)